MQAFDRHVKECRLEADLEVGSPGKRYQNGANLIDRSAQE